MIHNPVLCAIWTSREARVADAVGRVEVVLVEDASFVVFTPVLHVHWVVANELELAETVVTIVAASGGVDYEGLVRCWIGELLGPFVAG